MTTDFPTDLIAAENATSQEPVLRARIRWAGIVWGAVLGALAFAGLWILGSARRRDDVAEWLGQLTVPGLVGACILVVGALLLIAGLVGLLRRAQRSLTPAPAATATAGPRD